MPEFTTEEWLQNLDKTLAGEPSPAEFIGAVSGWLHTDIPEYTEGSYEAVSRRIVWEFPDGYAYVVGWGFPPTIYHMSELLTKESKFPLPQSMSQGWEFRVHANGWVNTDEENIWTPASVLSWVEKLASAHGQPKIIFPWGYAWNENVVDQAEDYYEYDEEKYEDTPELNPRKLMFRMVTAIGEGKIAAASPWETHFGEEDEGMSYYSDWSRFYRVVRAIEDQKLMIVNLDEHCAACNSGTYEWAVKDDPEMEGENIFLTWGQNSQGSWLGNGFISTEVYFSDEDDERAVIKLAIAEGLEEEDEDWEPVGEWWLESYS